MSPHPMQTQTYEGGFEATRPDTVQLPPQTAEWALDYTQTRLYQCIVRVCFESISWRVKWYK